MSMDSKKTYVFIEPLNGSPKDSYLTSWDCLGDILRLTLFVWTQKEHDYCEQNEIEIVP